MSSFEFKLPDVGEGLGQGEIVKWHVAVGDSVKTDQIICDVQTDKAIVEIPSPVSGTISALGGKPGDVLDVGAVLVVLQIEAGSNTPANAAPQPPATAGLTDGVAEPAPPSAAAGANRRVRASPATRKLARELGVDLTAMTGSGDKGQVTRQDVATAAQTPVSAAPATRAAAAPPAVNAVPAKPVSAPAPVGEDRIEPLIGLRRQIAVTMQSAWQNIPHIFSLREIDATALVAARRSVAADLEPRGIGVTYMPLFVKACVLALKSHPRFNASLDMAAERIIYRHRYNIGIATATPDGLIVTVVHDADRKSIAEIAVEIDELARLARERKASMAQLSNGTFTISNYGSQDGWMGTPIIRPPEVAIAGFGRIYDKVVPVDGQPAVRKVLPLTIATDHRINDGEHVGDFLATLTNFLGDPVRMLGHL